MSESHPIPSREDIDVYHSLDEASACEHFLGKSLDEAEALFRENSIYYQADLLWMGPAAFRFYIHAAIRYVKSDHAAGDSDIINCLAGTLRHRMQHEPLPELQPVAEPLAVFCAYIVEHFDRFDADPQTYGDLRSSYAALVTAFQRLSNSK